MTTGYIGILKQREMFQAYYQEEGKGRWEPIQLEGEEKSIWSEHSFDDILWFKQIDKNSSALGILVISDHADSIVFPHVQKVLSFSYEVLLVFCRKYAASAAHWIWQGKELNEELCQKVGFPMDETAGNQYILSSAELSGNLEDLLASESVIPRKEETVEDVVKPQEVIESTPVVQVPLTEKQRRHDAYFQDICNGDRENPLKKW